MISPDSQGGPNIALITVVCSWTFLVIALLSVSLLLWARRMKRVRLGSDDYLTLFALAATIALIAQTTWAIVDEGQDDHEDEVSRTKFALVVRSLLVNQTLWGLINTLIRMSAVLFIERIFGVSEKRRSITRSLLVLSILYGLVVFLEVFLICRPMAVDWSASVPGTCANQILSYLVLELVGLLLDFIIIAVPIPFIWSLQMTLPKKIPILIVFLVGVLVFIITGLRIQALHMVNAEDFTYSKGYLGLLSALGASFGIIIICAPVVPALYQQWRAALGATPIDEENATTNSETPDAKSLSMTEENTTWTRGKSARWSMDGCVTGVDPPPNGGLQKHHTV